MKKIIAILFLLLSFTAFGSTSHQTLHFTELERHSSKPKRVLLINGFTHEKDQPGVRRNLRLLTAYYKNLGAKVFWMNLRNYQTFFEYAYKDFDRIIWTSHAGIDGPSLIRFASGDTHFGENFISQYRQNQPLEAQIKFQCFAPDTSDWFLEKFHSSTNSDPFYYLRKRLPKDENYQKKFVAHQKNHENDLLYNDCLSDCNLMKRRSNPRRRLQSITQSCAHSCFQATELDSFSLDFSLSLYPPDPNTIKHITTIDKMRIDRTYLFENFDQEDVSRCTKIAREITPKHQDTLKENLKLYTKKIASILKPDGFIYFNGCNIGNEKFGETISHLSQRKTAVDFQISSMDHSPNRTKKIERNIPDPKIKIYDPKKP